MAEIQTQALTLKQVKAKLHLQWRAEQTRKHQNDNSTKQVQEAGDVYRHPLRSEKQFENTQ